MRSFRLTLSAKERLKKCLLVILLFECCLVHSYSQRVSFQNFGVDRGLIQSQVQCIAQDKQRHLWIGTFGGLDRFDGTTFSHFTKSSGLPSTGITSLYTADNGYIWAGHFKGISCYNGFRVINYAVPGKAGDFIFSRITEDYQGTIWAFSPGNGLFRLRDNQFIKAAVPSPGLIPVWIGRNSRGQLEAIFNAPGIYQYSQQGWEKKYTYSFLKPNEVVVSILEKDAFTYALTNAKRLLKIEGDQLRTERNIEAGNFGAFAIGTGDNIWIGTDNGVLIYDHADLAALASYTAVTGLSDNFITEIFKDAEGNVWIGTDGDGIFWYAGGAFSKYDSRNGLPGNIVMGIVNNNKGQLYIGLREGGLVKYDQQYSRITPVDYSSQSNAGINCMAYGRKGELYIGTLDNKLLLFDGHSFRRIYFKGNPFITVNSIVPGENEIWLATSAGCYYLERDTAKKIEGLDDITSGVLPLSSAETLIGSTGGLFISSQKGTPRRVSHRMLQNANITCLYLYNNYILAGTADEGMFWWNRTTDSVYHCDASNGLADDQVFDLYTDNRKHLWVGTGTGMQQVVLNEDRHSFSTRQFTENDGYERSENNLNAITADDKGRIWIGTTKGVFIYERETFTEKRIPPYAIIQTVSSPGINTEKYSEQDLWPWYHLPMHPAIAYRHNNISFTVKGISLKNPGSVVYSSKLEGYDTDFSVPSAQSFFNYQNLSPGSYVFKVRAFGPDGAMSENTAEYAFTVTRPFYKTVWFLIAVLTALFFTGILAHAAYHKIRQQRLLNQERQRAAEQEKIRQRTAEDFHDELGNKLTRISLLTDMLDKKEEGPDADHIIKQIKENVSALYTGTREIIWSLSPGNNNLKEVLARIEQFGNELFSDTSVDFTVTGMDAVDDTIILPIDYSRNLNMISKEILHNSLRHAGCTKVNVEFNMLPARELQIVYQDNGSGTDISNIKKGNGLTNIQQRAERINAAMEIITAPKEGMIIKIKLKIPSGGG